MIPKHLQVNQADLVGLGKRHLMRATAAKERTR